MNSTPSPKSPNTSKPRQIFKVVPPAPQREAPPAPPPAPQTPPAAVTDTSPKPQAASPFPYRRLLAIATIAAGVGLVSFIKVAPNVRGEVVVESTAGARDFIYMQIPGTITRMRVKTNDTVKPGDKVAELKSDELDQEIAEAQLQRDEAHSALQAAKQQLETVKAKYREAQAHEKTSSQLAERLRQDIAQNATGTSLPAVQKLEAEIEGLKSKIYGLKGDLEGLQKTIARYQSLAVEGAFSPVNLEEFLRQKSTLEGDIGERESQILAKQAEIASVTKEKQEQLEIRQAEVSHTAAASESALQEVEAALAEVENRTLSLSQLEAELQRRKQKQKHLFLQSDIAGTVITENLDRFENKHLSAGEPLLEIVNLSQLTASVKFRQEDADLIEPGAKVRFRPREAVLRDYTATVQEISPVVETDQSQQQRNLTVKIIIENDDSRLRPGVVGDARLETEPMPIYQNVQREFLKVVPVGKWF